jgi:predicted nucleic acid-binding protein
VDTSVLTRGHLTVVSDALKRIGTRRRAIVDLEIGYSASNELEWDALQRGLSIHSLVPCGAPELKRALELQRLLAGAGLKGRKVPQLIIAATAELAHLSVLHYDKDFGHIASLTGQPHDWVVPPGSID